MDTNFDNLLRFSLSQKNFKVMGVAHEAPLPDDCD